MVLIVPDVMASSPRFQRADISNFDVEIKENHVEISFESTLAESASELSGSGQKHVVLDDKALARLPHELVACVVGHGAKSDAPLTQIEKCLDASDRMTPDYISQREDGVWMVTEIKTCQAARLMTGVAQSAIDKYSAALQQRAIVRDIELYVLVVSYTSVVTNLELTEEEKRECMAHYCLGMELQQRCRDAGWVTDKEELQNDAEQSILAACRRMKLDEESKNCRGTEEPLHITADMVTKWTRMSSPGLMNLWGVNYWDAKSLLKERKTDPETNYLKTEEGFVKFFEKMKTVGERTDVDTLLHLPIALVKQCAYDPYWVRKPEWTTNMIEGDSPYANLWRKAIIAAQASPDNFSDILGEDLLKMALSEGSKAELSNERRNKHFKIKVELSLAESVELAKRGVQAKAMKDNIRVKEHYETSKKSFSPDTFTDDIDRSFQTARDLFDRRTKELSPAERNARPLAEEAIRLSGLNESLSERSLREFMRTHLANQLSFFDEVVGEVNISRIKHSRKNEFIMKKLPNYDAYLLIKTTSIDKQVFVSVMVPSESFRGSMPLTERWMDMGGCFITKFVSFDRHKLTHYLYSPYKAACLWFFWSQQYAVPPSSVEHAQGPDQVFNHFWLSMLVYLEDKEKTSSALQLVRYAYMEVVKGGILRPSPEKITKKLDAKVRSRLLLWCLRRMTTAFVEMTREPPQVGTTMDVSDVEMSQDTARNLLSWVTLEEVPNFEVALNLSYLGVLHNKDEGDKTHGYLKIFDKLISQELLMPGADVEKMTVHEGYRASELSDHEFSASAVKTFARTVRSKLEATHGNYRFWATDTMLTALRKKTVLNLATTKASTICDPKDLDEMEKTKKKVDKETKEMYKAGIERKKAMENMLELIQQTGIDGNIVYSKIDKIIDDIEQSGGMKVSLFKKLQIGGTREIFVLPIRERVAISFLECISRSLCENIGCEMLTKGDQKITRSDDHFKKRRELMKGMDSVTLISSDDAATWAQRFVMPVFGVMLNELVPEPFLTPCLRILNLVTSKKLMMPLDLVNLFMRHKDTYSTLDSMNSLKSEFMQGAKGVLIEKDGSRLITNRSNMMQGILHYTSSLLHACYMSSLSTMFREISKPYPSLDKVIVTAKVSSDDSSLLISIAKTRASEVDKGTLLSLGTIMCLMKKVMCSLFCAKQSDEKSSEAGSKLIEEFNSLWYYRNTLISPSIKYLAQVPRTHVSDRFETRLNVMSGIRAQLYEATGSTLLAAICQSAQLRCHYLALGMTSHKLFDKYSNILLESPHPSLGFFIYEHELLCGILGQNLALYMACRKSDKVLLLTKKFMISSSLTMLQIDAGMCRLALTQGSTTRYQSMLKRMGVEYETELDYYDNNPEKLFMPPMDQADLIHKLNLKAATPSVANSFEFLTDSKQHAASSYALHTDCVTRMERKITGFSEDGSPESVTTKTKVSLLKVVMDESIVEVGPEPVTLMELSWIFPNRYLYEVIVEQIIPNCEELVPTLKRRQRNWYFVHKLQKYDFKFIKKPAEVCAYKWFGIGSPGTTYEVDQTWSSLTSLLPWIKQDFRGTLLACPQGNAVGLHSFLRQLDTPLSGLKVIAPIRPKPRHEDAIASMICRSFWPCYFLEVPMDMPCHIPRKFSLVDEEGTCPGEHQASAQKQTALAMRTCLWLYNESMDGPVKLDTLETVCNYAPDVVPIDQINKETQWQFLDATESRMAVIQSVVKHKVEDIGALLKRARRGLMGHFSLRAKYNPASGCYEGPAVFQGHYNGVAFKAHMTGDKLEYFELQKESGVKAFSVGLYELVRELKCPKMCTTRSFGIAGFLDLHKTYIHSLPGVNRAPYRISKSLKVPRLKMVGNVTVDTNGTIRVALEDRGRQYTALTLRIMAPRTLQYQNYLDYPEDSLMWFWMMGESLPLLAAKEIIARAAATIRNFKKIRPISDDDWSSTLAQEDWIRRTLKNRAAAKKVFLDSAIEIISVTSRQSDEMIRTLTEIRREMVAAAPEPESEDDEIDLSAFIDKEISEIASGMVLDADFFSDFVVGEGEDDTEPRAADLALNYADWDCEVDLSSLQFCRPELASPYQLKRMDNSDHPIWDILLDKVTEMISPKPRAMIFSGVCEEGFIARVGEDIAELYAGHPVRVSRPWRENSLAADASDFSNTVVQEGADPLGE